MSASTSPTTWPGRHGSSCGPLFSRPTPMSSRTASCWEGLPRERLAVIAPCIDAFAQEPDPGAGHGQRHLAHGRDPGGPGHGRGDPGVSPLGREPGPGGAEGGNDPGPADPPRSPAGGPGVTLGSPEGSPGVLQGFARHVPDELGAHLLWPGRWPPAALTATDTSAFAQSACSLAFTPMRRIGGRRGARCVGGKLRDRATDSS